MASLFSLLFVLLLFLQRPAALGQTYAGLGLVALAFLTVVYLVWVAWRRPKLQAIRSMWTDLLVLMCFVAFYLIYELVIAVAFGLSDMGPLAKEFVITVVVIGCYSIFLMGRNNNETFFRQFTTVVSLLGWSSAITVIALFFVPMESLQLFQLELKGYEGDDEQIQPGMVLLPLSMVYMQIGVFELPLPRFAGFFREPGIYQAIAAYCLVLAFLALRSRFIKAGLILGIILTFSTIGMAMLVAALGISYYLTRRVTLGRIAMTGAILVLAVIALIFTPVVGILDKSDTAAVSVDDRMGATLRGIERFGENPFGDGPFTGKEANQGINLIAAIGSIGVIGFLLQVLIASGYRGNFSRTTLARMGACAPLLITMLTSQPIATAAVIYVLVMVWPQRDQGQRVP